MRHHIENLNLNVDTIPKICHKLGRYIYIKLLENVPPPVIMRYL